MLDLSKSGLYRYKLKVHSLTNLSTFSPIFVQPTFFPVGGPSEADDEESELSESLSLEDAGGGGLKSQENGADSAKCK